MTFFLNGPAEPPKIKANNPAVDLPTWGEGLGAAATSAQLENDSNFVAARRKIGVKDNLASEVVPRLGMDQIRPIIEERNAKAIANGMPSQVVEIPDNVEDAVALMGPNFSERAIEMAREAAAADPEGWADVDLSDEAIEDQTNEVLRAEYEDAQEILEMMPGGRGAAEFIGGMAGITADVKNLPFLAMGGGGGSIMRVMGREAAINMGAEAAFLPSQYKMAERLDIPDPSVASQLALAAGAGAILGGAMTAAQRGWTYYRGRNRVEPIGRMSDLESQAMVDQVEDILTSDTAQPFEQINRMMDEAGEAVQEPPYRLENPINPERPPLLPTDPPEFDALPPEVTTTQLPPAPTAAPDPEVSAAPKKPATPRPTTLKTFVVREGGIWKGDDTGEIAGMEYRRPGFLKNEKRVTSSAGDNKGGLTVDEMRERAVEQGYLPEGATINDFLDALDGDVRGTGRVYSQADGTAAEEWRIFDDGPTEGVEGAQRVFSNQKPRDDADDLFINPGKYQFDTDPIVARENIARDVVAWMDKRGYGAVFTDAQKNEIIDALANERGGYAEDLIDLYLEREAAEFSGAPRAREIENDVPFGEPEPAPQEVVGQRPEGVGGRQQDAPAEAGSTARSGRDSGPVSEATAAGDQTLIEGVMPISQRDRLEAQQNKPLRGGALPADDGLFDVGARSQIDMFSDPTSPESREVQDVVANDLKTEIEADGDFDLEIETPDGGTRVMSARGLLDYLDEGDNFAARIELCGKGPET